MPETTLRSTWKITINGSKDLWKEFEGDIDEIIVDSSLYLPDMFAIRLQVREQSDGKLKWIDDQRFAIGNKVVLEATAATIRDPAGVKTGKLIEGEITALEPDFSKNGIHTLLIRGYDLSNRLHFGRVTRTYTKMSDKDIVQAIAGEVGLTPKVDGNEATVKFDYVIQYNQTYAEFLAERAKRIGYQVYVQNSELFFKKGDKYAGVVGDFEIGEELLSFRPRMTVAHQASSMRVVGWDPIEKQKFEGKSDSSNGWNQGGMKETGGQIIKSKFVAAEFMVVDYPISTQDEAEAMAMGLSSDLSSEFVEAEGVCQGDPRIKAGIRISLKGLGNRFNGEYFVTSANHVLSARDFETHFTVNGRQPNTFSHLLGSGHRAGDSRGLVNGVVVGLVDGLDDELKLGRVRVKFPWLIDKDNAETVSAWAKVASPMAGQDKKGVYFLPEVNDEVLVAFEHGDMNRPYIVGTLWNNKDQPPEPSDVAVVGGKVVHRIIRSRLGHEICFDDSDDKASIYIVDKTGNNSIFIDSNKNSMDIKVQGDLTIDVGGNIKVTSKMATSFDVGAAMDIAVKANLTVKANGTATVQSISNFVLKSSTNMSVEAGITTDVKGSLINVGTGTTGTTTITGMLVKIN